MAKTPPAPLTSEQRQGVLQALANAPAPQTAADLFKRLPAALGLKRPQVEEVLAAGVTEGSLVPYPATTAKGKPRFWHQTLAAWLTPPLRDLLSAATEPLSAAPLAKLLTLGVKVSEADLQPVLDQLCQSGDVHRYPPATAKGKPRYATRSPADLLRPAILRVLTTKGGLPLPKLVAALKGTDPGLIQQTVEQLCQERQLFVHPPLGKGGGKSAGKSAQSCFKTTPIAPLEFLEEVRTALRKTVPTLQAAGVPPEELRRALVQLATEVGIPLATAAMAGQPATGSHIPASSFPANAYAANSYAGSGPTGSVPGPPGPSVPAGAPTVDLVSLMRQLNPGADTGTLIGAAELRQRAGLPKEEFDRQAVALARAGRISLHEHDFRSRLSPEEQAQLIHDGVGRYYTGLSLRQ
ncbi:MAG: hypothetical protein ACK5EA_14645 [Planctomycetaceae bacterium]